MSARRAGGSDSQGVVGRGSRDYPFLLMSVATAHELWLWLVTGASDRLRELADLASAPECDRAMRLRSEERFLRRLTCAFEYYVENRRAHEADYYRSDSWVDGFEREGVDELGLALFSNYLTQQSSYWKSLSDGDRYARGVVISGAPVIDEFSKLFYDRLGVSPNDVRCRAEDLFLEEDQRSQPVSCTSYWRSPFRVVQLVEEGRLTRDDLEEREYLLGDIAPKAAAAEEAS